MDSPLSQLERCAALRQLPIPGGWAEQRISCKGREWEFLLPADADAFLNQLESLPAGSEEPDVYWAKLWPPALTVAAFVLQSDWPPQTRVLELGCGIGIVGLAALAAGYQVTFSDYVPLAVEVAIANAVRNGYSQARGLVFDWRAPVAEQFDVVLGSDILYDRTCHAALVGTLHQVLAAQGTAWIGDAGRYHVSSFVDLARRSQFAVSLQDERFQALDSLTSGRFQMLRLMRTNLPAAIPS